MTPGFSSPLAWSLHGLAMTASLVGIVFLLLWAARTLTPAQLKTWGIALVIGGFLACALTLLVTPFHRAVRFPAMERMMEWEEGAVLPPNVRQSDDDWMEMSMDDMTGMMHGQTGDAFDRAFLEGMIPHHQGAIDMARAAQQSARHEEIKRMADDIIETQQREIDQMRQWMREWGYGE